MPASRCRSARLAGPACAVLAGLVSGCGGAAPPGGAAVSLQASDAYTRLPVAFERNVGQADRRARFVARGRGYALLLTDRAPLLGIARHGGTTRWLRLGLAGTSSRMRVTADTPASGTVNYLVGRDRSRWHTDVPTYGRVRYRDAYPGIAVAFHGTNRSLEYDFELAPGADPARIRLAPTGQRSLRITPAGALELGFAGGTVREATPRSQQLVDGVRRVVSSRFVQRAGGTIGIRVGRYDHGRPLTIDPVLTYSSLLGGAGFDIGNAIAVDVSGAAYVTGTTASTAFPTTGGAAQGAFAGNQDVFVTKLSAGGDSFAYSTYLGGGDIDIANGIAVDASGAAYITGTTSSADFPLAGAYQGALAGGSGDGFVTKLTPSGGGLAYSTYLGGSLADTGAGIAVDATGAAYVTGQTASSDFPATGGAVQATYQGGSADAFVTKLQPAGSTLAYSTFLGGSGQDIGSGIAIDGTGAAYVVGKTGSAGFPATAGAAQTTLHGTMDAFATKIAPSGAAPLAYSTFIGGSDLEQAYSVAVDGSGAAYVTGYTYSGNFPLTGGAAQPGFSGGVSDGFVSKFSPTGTTFVYSTYLGGNGTDAGRGVAVDSSGAVLLIGTTTSTNFPVTAGAVQDAYGGGSGDGFLIRLSASGSSRAYSTYIGGSSAASALGVAVDSAGDAYLTGSTSSSDFPVTSGAAQTTSGGSVDAFVTKLIPVAPVDTTTTTTTDTTTTPANNPPDGSTLGGPTLIVKKPRIAWNRVAIGYRLIKGRTILLEVIGTDGLAHIADLRSGSARGTVVWNRRLGGRVAKPGRYRLRFTASGVGRGITRKTISVRIGLLYAHAPRVRSTGVTVGYELAEPASVTLTATSAKGTSTVVARRKGHRGANHITWDLRVRGRRATGRYELSITARTVAGATARVVVPAPGAPR